MKIDTILAFLAAILLVIVCFDTAYAHSSYITSPPEQSVQVANPAE